MKRLRFKHYASVGFIFVLLVFWTGTGVMEMLGIPVFGFIFNSLGRNGTIAAILIFCFLMAVFAVFWGDDNDRNLDIPKSAWGWVKAVVIILLLTAAWFSSCVIPSREYPYF